MNNSELENDRTRKLLIWHFNKYPNIEPWDIFKYIFQSSFGCEHMVSDEISALEYIKQEYKLVSKTEVPYIEPLDGEYSRVYLSCLNDGLLPETLSKIFCLSSKKEQDGKTLLKQKIEVVKKLVADGTLPFEQNRFSKCLDEWKNSGYSSVHHSDAFRSRYRPFYRVISNKYVDFLRVFSEIDKLLKNESVIVAIEGGSASGKTTLSEMLEEIYGCTVFHMDDFFLRPEQRTEARLSEVGGNIDRERFFDEVLKPLSEHREVEYRKFDCSTQTLGSPLTLKPCRLTVVEGAYSMHPCFNSYYDFSVFLDIDSEFQRERIIKRNSKMFAERFFNEWIPLEQRYFLQMNIKNKCSLCIKVAKNDIYQYSKVDF